MGRGLCRRRSSVGVCLVFRLSFRGEEGTYDGNDSVVLQKGMETADELMCEELDGLSTAGEDVVDDVVILRRGRGFLALLDEGAGVVDDGGVVGWQAEVLACELVDDGVNLDDCGVDAMAD